MAKSESAVKPMFSVVIPTYNRAEYLRYTLETCREQSHSSVEFIVQDDNSSDHTRQVVESFCGSDNRFKYCNIGQNAGMRDNFENALNNTIGEYLIFLGGDDALLPNALMDLESIIHRHPKKIVTWPVATYYYDEVVNGEGHIIAPHTMFNNKIEQIIKSVDYFTHQSRELFYVSDNKSPMIYVKSAVPRESIESVTARSDGVFFSSSTPDGYSGFALAAIAESYVYTNYSLTMHGISPSSAGLNYVRGKNDQNDHSLKFFKESKSVPMAPQLASQPYSPVIALMTADFLFRTDNIFENGFSKQIDIEELISKSLFELCNGNFDEGKIQRELSIIHNISSSYGKNEIFFDKISTMKRKNKSQFSGDMISPNVIILDAKKRNIKNVRDASNFIGRMRNKRGIFLSINPLKVLIKSLSYKIETSKEGRSLAEFYRS